MLRRSFRIGADTGAAQIEPFLRLRAETLDGKTQGQRLLGRGFVEFRKRPYLGLRKLRVLGQNSHAFVLTSYNAATRLSNDLTRLLRGVVFVGQSELDRRFGQLAEFAASIERQMMEDAPF